MDVQHGCTGIVAIDRLLDLVSEGNRNVFGEVSRQLLRPIRRDLNHELLLVFREQGIVKEMHCRSPLVGGRSQATASAVFEVSARNWRSAIASRSCL
jgi:hypothetical protein